MDEGRRETRAKLRSIYSIKSFEALLEDCVLTEAEKELLRLHYLQGHDFAYIGDLLGFSESAIKKKHRKILTKLNRHITI